MKTKYSVLAVSLAVLILLVGLFFQVNESSPDTRRVQETHSLDSDRVLAARSGSQKQPHRELVREETRPDHVPPSAIEESKGAASGLIIVVRDEGIPREGVMMQLLSWPQGHTPVAWASTSTEGSCRFDLPPGDYYLCVSGEFQPVRVPQRGYETYELELPVQTVRFVVRDQNGHPRPGGEVWRSIGDLIEPSYKVGVANEFGVVETVVAGRSNFWAQHPEFLSSRRVAVDEESVGDVALELREGGRQVVGIVLLPDGRPAADSQVVGGYRAVREERREWDVCSNASTDESGRFVLPSMPTGPVPVWAMLDGWAPGSALVSQDSREAVIIYLGVPKTLEVRRRDGVHPVSLRREWGMTFAAPRWALPVKVARGEDWVRFSNIWEGRYSVRSGGMDGLSLINEEVLLSGNRVDYTVELEGSGSTVAGSVTLVRPLPSGCTVLVQWSGEKGGQVWSRCSSSGEFSFRGVEGPADVRAIVVTPGGGSFAVGSARCDTQCRHVLIHAAFGFDSLGSVDEASLPSGQVTNLELRHGPLVIARRSLARGSSALPVGTFECRARVKGVGWVSTSVVIK